MGRILGSFGFTGDTNVDSSFLNWVEVMGEIRCRL